MPPTRINNTILLATGISLIALTTAVFGTRMYLGIVKQRRFSWEDGWLIAAWAVFITITSLYLNIGPAIFRLEALGAGEIPLYPTINDDSLALQKTFFVTTSGLWVCLWLVKASLLSLYKRLVGTVRTYLIAWWIVAVICVITLALAITSSMLSCSSMKAWFTAGACGTPRDIKASFISLWYSYAVDVLTDLLVMLLPILLIRGLQMPTKRKLSIAGLFGLGWICIGISTLRAAYLGNDSTREKFRQPSTSWLALWAIVEASIAVIIGCCPGLYREAKIISSKSNNYYPERGYNGSYRFGSNGQHRSESHGPDIRLSNYPRPGVKDRDDGSSQEDLVETLDKNQIMVTRSVHVREQNLAEAQGSRIN